MPGGRAVVSNTSPLLNLALVERLDLLESQFETITVPERVWDELLAGDEGLAALRELRSEGFLEVETFDDDDLFVELSRELDAGEAACITYAIENGADLVLLDEREGRKAARRHGLDVTGVIGVLLRGVEDGSVTSRPSSTGSEAPGSGFRTNCTRRYWNEGGPTSRWNGWPSLYAYAPGRSRPCLAAVVVGTALYDGGFTLREAREAA